MTNTGWKYAVWAVLAATIAALVLQARGEPEWAESGAVDGPTALGSMDVVFVIDTTGSMADEIAEVKNSVLRIAAQLEAEMAELEAAAAKSTATVPPTLRMGAVFYRDVGDGQDMIEAFPLTTNVPQIKAALGSARARGGGDYPEHVGAGLHVGLDMAWRVSPDVLKIMYLIGDAPSQTSYTDGLDVASAIARAQNAGIVVNAIGCSGLNAAGEAEFRGASDATNGVFDHLVYSRRIQTPDGQYQTIFQVGGKFYEAAPGHELDDSELERGIAALVDDEVVVLSAAAAEKYYGGASGGRAGMARRYPAGGAAPEAMYATTAHVYADDAADTSYATPEPERNHIGTQVASLAKQMLAKFVDGRRGLAHPDGEAHS